MAKQHTPPLEEKTVLAAIAAAAPCVDSAPAPAAAIQSPPAPKPTIGRIVHFVARGTPFGLMGNPDKHRAAVVTDTHDDGSIDLYVMNPRGEHPVNHAYEDPDRLKPWSWHWPERD